MDNIFDVSDPSDWLGTPVSKLASVETALRCQVCKDFFITPVITSCSHTFCSLCIRRCLTTDGKCPTCRAVDQEMKLRPNSIVQELVDAFQVVRPEILQLGKDVAYYKEAGSQNNKKRNFEALGETDELAPSGPATRKKTTRSHRKDGISDDAMNDNDARTYYGLAQCPICGMRMKEEEVFTHLDVHNESENTKITVKKDATIKNPRLSFEKGSRLRTQPNLMTERLPHLNYSLLNDNILRKKLSALGLPNHGPRALLARRHTEWVNIVNSNCDSANPKSKRELLHDLEVWERSQGRQIVSNGSSGPSVMDKDFDGAEWAVKHDSNFQRLIVEARKARSHKKETDPGEMQGSASIEANPTVGDIVASKEQGYEATDSDQLSSPAVDSGLARRQPSLSSTSMFVDLDAGG